MARPNQTHVCLIGVGLIGGSLGLALRKNKPEKYVISGVGRDPRKLRLAKQMGAIDHDDLSAHQAVSSADIVVLCVPVHKIVPQLKKIVKWLKSGAIVTDVGSVKRRIVDDAKRVLKSRTDVQIVGAHPIAGSEKTGVKNASATLFKNATCVITGALSPARQKDAVVRITKLWNDAGARCVMMSTTEHDRALALTSHLPHLLSFALFQSVSEAAQKNPVIRSLVAGSFRDMTRIAGADAELWAGILETNRVEIKKTVRDAALRLERFAQAPLSKLLPTLRQLQRAKQQWPTKQ